MATRRNHAGSNKRTKITIAIDEQEYRSIGTAIMNRKKGGSERVFSDRWRSFFGVGPAVVVELWSLLDVDTNHPDTRDAAPCHLLWALMLLMQYGSAETMSSHAGCDEKTFRKWSLLFVHRISYLMDKVVIWENRKIGDIGNDCLVSIDCTDCKVPKQNSNAKAFTSHKFKESGVRYEIAVCIITGEIVWVMGPLPCGDWPDVEVFRFAIKHMLGPFERVEADDGFIGEDPEKAKVPASMVHDQDDRVLRVRSIVRRRHETVNKRIKQFRSVKNVFEHDLTLHAYFFRACVVLTQLSIKNGEPLFSVDDYKDVDGL